MHCLKLVKGKHLYIHKILYLWDLQDAYLWQLNPTLWEKYIQCNLKKNMKLPNMLFNQSEDMLSAGVYFLITSSSLDILQ